MPDLKTRLIDEFPPMEAALDKALALLPQSVEPIAAHIFAAGGKRLRPFLTMTVQNLINGALVS